ncbi:hypothetical protein ACFW1P_20565 [Paenibacillus sp. NPDC058910]|uniref:hypothetical protein n=1 Tax=unclassified Paenibacillus TaxID=185978 RepID=UPI00367DFA1A
MHIKSNNLEKTVEALRELSEGSAEVLGKSSIPNQSDSDAVKSEHEAQEVVMYISKSNENWDKITNALNLSMVEFF